MLFYVKGLVFVVQISDEVYAVIGAVEAGGFDIEEHALFQRA